MDAMLFDIWFALPVAATLLGLLALAPLGEQVIHRGVVFIDLAVAQAAAAAALWATSWVPLAGWWFTQIIALSGALLSTGFIAWLAKRWPLRREALIGILYVWGASSALLGSRQDSQSGERMAQLLAADILWVGWPQVATMAACTLLAWLAAPKLAQDRVFYPVFAIVVSLAVPVLGLYLVFASLIAPAVWRSAGYSRTIAWGGSCLACTLGLAASWLLDAPSGACLAFALSAYGIASVLWIPRQSPV
ncbi:MAG: metal ABC transporter permease [Gammaproteobacteria bacterium]|nr:metal ABC transporter permease [Gammaproteobacteria bacterium]